MHFPFRTRPSLISCLLLLLPQLLFAADPAPTDAAPAAAAPRQPASNPFVEAPSDNRNGSYVLKTGDRIQFRLAEDPIKGETPNVVVINTVGEASFPVSRNFDLRITCEARGKTIDEVKSQLTRRLLEAYYKVATVELALDDRMQIPGKIQFFGAGGVAGEVQLPLDGPPLKLSETLLRRSPPEYARLRKVKLHRVDAATGKERIIEVNVEAIIKEGQRDKDFDLQDGDRIEVSEKWLY